MSHQLLRGAAGALAAFALALPASAGASFQTGLSGGEYTSPDAGERDLWFDRTLESRAGIVRIDVSWRAVTSGVPADPADPADPAYDFSVLDASVSDAAARGLTVLLTIFRAPDFAEGPDREPSAEPGSWRPDPAAYAAFARAVATRYSGGFQGLPRVRHFQAWNEPNLATYISPQWGGGQLLAAAHYRSLLNAFYDAVKEVRGDNQVVTAGTAPYGERPGRDRTRPLRFWREVFCLKERRKLKPVSCPTKPRFDILAHHPINTSGGPRRSAVHPDDASTPDFDRVRRTLRAAERAGHAQGAARHPLWATEIWWESDPPDSFRGVGLKRHARYIEEALYLLWKQGARAVINLLIRDGVYDPQQPLASIEAGIYFHDGGAKPAQRAFRFPFVTERRSKRKLRAWARAPVTGRLVIQRKTGRGWRSVRHADVRAGAVVRAKLSVRGKEKLRARIGDEKSLVWVQL